MVRLLGLCCNLVFISVICITYPALVEPFCPKLDKYNNNTTIYLGGMTVCGVCFFSLALLEIQQRGIMPPK